LTGAALRDDLAHWVALNCVPGLGPAGLAQLLRRFGSPARILLETAPEQLSQAAPIDSDVARRIAEAGRNLDKFARYVEQLAADGIQVVTLADPRYPRLLMRAPNPPPVIYMAGSYQADDENSIGIIGATEASDKGFEIGRECARRLAARGCTIVSGYASGIDTSGHLGALDVGGRTVFVLPMGIRTFQPRPGLPQGTELTAHGVLLSEAPPDDNWQRVHALARNRLTAALSRRLLVIESGETGGTMHTVSIARKIGVPVYVIRYREAPPTASGNELVARRGGIALSCFADIDRLAAGDLDPATLTQKQFDW
jgi:DNA processing protein